MVVSVTGDALEVRMGAASSRAEVYDATTNRLRVELTGSGAVVEFVFPESGGPANVVRYNREVFARLVGSGGR